MYTMCKTYGITNNKRHGMGGGDRGEDRLRRETEILHCENQLTKAETRELSASVAKKLNAHVMIKRCR